MELGQFMILTFMCGLESAQQAQHFAVLRRKDRNTGFPGLPSLHSSSPPKLVMSFFFPPASEQQVLIPQLALTSLISLPTLSLSTGLPLEPPSLATGFAITPSTLVEDLGKTECPPLGIPSPSPISIRAQNMWSALLLWMAEKKVLPWLVNSQQVTCFLVCRGTQRTFRAGGMFWNAALCCLNHRLLEKWIVLMRHGERSERMRGGNLLFSSIEDNLIAENFSLD